LQTKLAKYAPKSRGASLRCNRGRLRTLFPRYHTTKTHICRARCPQECVAVRVPIET